MDNRCVSCGYLCAKSKEHSNAVGVRFYEVQLSRRSDGRIISSLTGADYSKAIDSTPHCILGKADLARELRESRKDMAGNKGFDVIRDIINVDRKCQAWTQYQEGLSPTQHLELQRLKALEGVDKRQHREVVVLTLLVILLMVIQLAT